MYFKVIITDHFTEGGTAQLNFNDRKSHPLIRPVHLKSGELLQRVSVVAMPVVKCVDASMRVQIRYIHAANESAASMPYV